MPTISIFYGIIIQMFWEDHSPPHFHARYEKYKISINIRTLAVMRGAMPPRALSLILEWALQNQQSLLEDWELCQKNQPPHKITPLS